MRARFDQQLEELNTALITMGTLCENAISLSVKGLIDGDASLRESVPSVAAEVSRKEREIETLCMKLLLLQQPVAHDLRTVSSALKMIYDMDRVGILAVDIAENSKFVDFSAIGDTIPVREMALCAIGMVSDSIDAFVARDLSLAQNVILRDDTVDELFDTIRYSLIDIITQKAHHEYCIDLLMIVKYLEKIGDHAVNIASWVCYSITGKHFETL